MVINKKSQTWKTFNENKWHNACMNLVFTLFSQKSEHIVTTHYSSMSGSNKLVENHPFSTFYESYVSPGKKENPMVGPFF
jgi:hypothetical protein